MANAESLSWPKVQLADCQYLCEEYILVSCYYPFYERRQYCVQLFGLMNTINILVIRRD